MIRFLSVCPFLLFGHVLPGQPRHIALLTSQADLHEALRYNTAWIADPIKGDTVAVIQDSVFTVLQHKKKWHR